MPFLLAEQILTSNYYPYYVVCLETNLPCESPPHSSGVVQLKAPSGGGVRVTRWPVGSLVLMPRLRWCNLPCSDKSQTVRQSNSRSLSYRSLSQLATLLGATRNSQRLCSRREEMQQIYAVRIESNGSNYQSAWTPCPCMSSAFTIQKCSYNTGSKMQQYECQ